MGCQVRITHAVFGHHLPEPDAPARGNDRFIVCECGWLVQLNATGRAGARRTDYRDPATACTNFYCTGKKDHKDHRTRYMDNQARYRDNIHSGEARLIKLTDEPPAPPPPPPGLRLARRWRGL